VVDDYEPWRRFVCSTLQKQPGLQVICEISDGLDAVRKAQELQPDLILLDIGLPTIDGIEAAKRIREHSSISKILFCTENHSPDIAEAALRTGASGYVVKSDAARDLLQAVTVVLAGKQFVSSRFADHDFARTSDTSAAPEQGHVVQFYGNDTDLLENLDALFSATLAEGGSVTAAITRSHRRDLEERLIARGISIGDAIKEGQLAILNADEVLSEFMDPVGPNRERFLVRLGEAVRKAKAAVRKNGRVVLFGEMVAVLWAQGKQEAAIRLEELWNELAQTHSFYLCCAYPASEFQELKGEAYATICAEHSQVVSAF
jgi:DNA-binding NarL/FixJ family response regulator